MVAHACNPSYSGAWGRRIAWTREVEVAVGQDCAIALQAGQQEWNSISKKQPTNQTKPNKQKNQTKPKNQTKNKTKKNNQKTKQNNQEKQNKKPNQKKQPTNQTTRTTTKTKKMQELSFV